MSDQEQEIFEIISQSGNAKSFAFEALSAVESCDFAKAEKLINKADQALSLAHKTQTKLIQDELNGKQVTRSLLLIHAQDHLMTAISEQKLVEHLIRIAKKFYRSSIS